LAQESDSDGLSILHKHLTAGSDLGIIKISARLFDFAVVNLFLGFLILSSSCFSFCSLLFHLFKYF
jgi:hypothetical protein